MSPRQEGREHEKTKRVRAWGAGACGCGCGAGRGAVGEQKRSKCAIRLPWALVRKHTPGSGTAHGRNR